MTKKEVLSIIRGMPTKYCNLDPIPLQGFKDLALYLAEELTKLVNVSLMHEYMQRSAVGHRETIAQENRN